MAGFVFMFLIVCTLVSRFLCLEDLNEQEYGLHFSSTHFSGGSSVVLRKGDSLNLTCKITSASNNTVPKFKITIQTPYYAQNSVTRVVRNDSYNSVNIVVQNLQESDGGDYKCQAISCDEEQTQFQQVLLVVVKNKKCGPHFFQCLSGVCIMKRYTCDGLPDCKGGEDESSVECGPNPCENKLRCDDHRCIPIDWCCDTIHDSNCTARVPPSCCLQLSKSFMDHDPGYVNEPPPQGLNDMGFLQTTIYTVVGCAMAFMFIVTILVIAICRVHMKRSLLLTRCPTTRGGIMMSPISGNRAPHHHHHHGLQHMPLYDLDVLLNRPSYPPASSVSPHSGLLVTYNINNGVQFVGRPIDPPPYCEIVASPPREGPPPPYASHEILPDASSVEPDNVDDVPCERDSLLAPSREMDCLENGQLRDNTEYSDTLAPDLLNAGAADRNRHVGSAVSLTVSSEIYEHNAVSDPDTISSLQNDERLGELSVVNGVSVNSYENLVVVPKVPDANDSTLRNVEVTGKSSADVPNTRRLDSSVNKISRGTQDESSFNVVCHSQENPLQCLSTQIRAT